LDIQQEKSYLIAMLNITIKISNNDDTILDDINIINTLLDVSDNNVVINYKNQINTIIQNEIDNINIDNKDYVINIINILSNIDKNYFIERINIKLLPLNDTIMVKNYINEFINKTDITDDKINLFSLYNIIANIAIPIRDKVLLQNIIDKINTLE